MRWLATFDGLEVRICECPRCKGTGRVGARPETGSNSEECTHCIGMGRLIVSSERFLLGLRVVGDTAR